MHFLTSCNQCFEWNVSWKVLEKRIFEPCTTLEFGLCKSWKVLEKSIWMFVRTLVTKCYLYHCYLYHYYLCCCNLYCCYLYHCYLTTITLSLLHVSLLPLSLFSVLLLPMMPLPVSLIPVLLLPVCCCSVCSYCRLWSAALCVAVSSESSHSILTADRSAGHHHWLHVLWETDPSYR